MKSTGERIKALLNEKKMTQRQLAELSGVTESALSHYIKGDRIPSGVASVNIAYALSTTINYILGKDDLLDFSSVKRILEQNKNKMTNEEKAELIELLFRKDYKEETIMDRKQESLYKYEVYCPVCGATWKRKTRCKLVRDSDLFYCKRCEVELKVRLIGGKETI